MDLQYVVMTKDGFIPAMDEWLALDIAFGDVEMDHATVNAYLDELRSMGANESRKLGGINFLRFFVLPPNPNELGMMYLPT